MNSEVEKKYHIEHRYIQNIFYVIGVLICAIIYFCIYYGSSLETILFSGDVSCSTLLLMFELIIKNISIWLIPAIIIDSKLKRKKVYSIGLNLDRFAVRDILYGTLLASLAFAIIVFWVYLFRENVIVKLDFSYSQASFIHNLWVLNDATVEELIFRGLVFQNFFRKNNSVFVIIISSVLFSLVHFFYASWDTFLFINVFLAGVLFCQMYAITKSLWSSIAFHSIWNLILFNLQISSYSNIINIESEYITAVVLILLIVLVNIIYKPSYKINKYFLLHS